MTEQLGNGFEDYLEHQLAEKLKYPSEYLKDYFGNDFHWILAG